MGNNHDKYFGKDKRNILILGLPQSGKTTMLQTIIQGKQTPQKVQKTKDLNIKDAKFDGLNVTFFDLAGGQRQRIFWKQHFQGTQGIIFLIDGRSSEENIITSLTQIGKLCSAQILPGIPVAVCISKTDVANQKQVKVLQQRATSSLRNIKLNTKIFTTSVKHPEKIKDMMGWLLKQTKPL